MINKHSCGGNVVPINFDARASVARFKCDKCGQRFLQRKRQAVSSKGVRFDDVEADI